MTRALTAFVFLWMLAAPVAAQSPSAWHPPLTPDGQPDIQGYWDPDGDVAAHSIEEGAEPAQVRVQGRPGNTVATLRKALREKVTFSFEEYLPYQPWAVAVRKKHLENLFAPAEWRQLDPEDRCLIEGVPRINYRGPWQILQSAGYVTIIYEWNHSFRVIPLGGRRHPGPGVRLWNGDSIGRWEGNTLVIDVTNFLVDPAQYNMQPWFDSHGTFYSDALHVVERYTFVDADTIRYEATVEDPKVFTRPWTMAFNSKRNKQQGYEFLEWACIEGDRNTPLMVEAGRFLRAKGETGIHEHDK